MNNFYAVTDDFVGIRRPNETSANYFRPSVRYRQFLPAVITRETSSLAPPTPEFLARSCRDGRENSEVREAPRNRYILHPGLGEVLTEFARPRRDINENSIIKRFFFFFRRGRQLLLPSSSFPLRVHTHTWSVGPRARCRNICVRAAHNEREKRGKQRKAIRRGATQKRKTSQSENRGSKKNRTIQGRTSRRLRCWTALKILYFSDKILEKNVSNRVKMLREVRLATIWHGRLVYNFSENF